MQLGEARTGHILKVVIAPDAFKGSLDAADVAAALAAGWRSHRADDLVLLPMADGGEGTLDAFAAAIPGATRQAVAVTGPDGTAHKSEWLHLPHGVALVELAQTSGITLMDPLLPLDATSRGVGEAIRAALATKPRRLLVAIGGSASSDGGAGMLQALGAELLDESGQPIGFGARGLAELASVSLSGLPELPPEGIWVLSDVTAPLLGAQGAAAVFAPQKGATVQDVAFIEKVLTRFADQVDADGVQRARAGTGAAGGCGFALALWGAELVSGASTVADQLGLAEALVDADVVITGEGSFDEQSAQGKMISELLRLVEVERASRGVGAGVGAGAADSDSASPLGASAGRPLRSVLVAGRIVASPREFDLSCSLSDLAGSEGDPIADAALYLGRAGHTLAKYMQ